MPRVVSVTRPQVHSITMEEVIALCGGKAEVYADPQDAPGAVIVTPEGKADLFQFIHWGEYHPNNLKEQQCIPVGYPCFDPEKQLPFIVVTAVLHLYCTRRSRTNSALGDPQRQAMVEQQIQDEIGCMNTITAPEGREVGLRGNDLIAPIFRKLGKLSLVGKIHTHPQMDVFLSGTDKLGHVSGADFWVSMVANPQARKMSAFGGQAAKTCKIIFCEKQDAESTDM